VPDDLWGVVFLLDLSIFIFNIHEFILLSFSCFLMISIYSCISSLLIPSDIAYLIVFIFFLGMLVQVLIEMNVWLGMKENGLESISIYPKCRDCDSPTTSGLLSIFDNIEYHRIWSHTSLVQILQIELSVKQKEILRLAGIPFQKYELNEWLGFYDLI